MPKESKQRARAQNIFAGMIAGRSTRPQTRSAVDQPSSAPIQSPSQGFEYFQNISKNI